MEIGSVGKWRKFTPLQASGDPRDSLEECDNISTHLNKDEVNRERNKSENARYIVKLYLNKCIEAFKTHNWIPLAYLLLILPLTSAAHFNLKECPSNETAWRKRSDTFECKAHEAYHCIMNKQGMLMEICMTPYIIIPLFEGGCISASPTKGGKYMLDGHYHSCEGVGCPQKNDSNYWTNELYKYPRCIQTLIAETTAYATTSKPVIETTTGRGIDRENTSSRVIIEEWEIALVSAIIVCLLAIMY